jgi:tetratricopeptide (TPR) repeat protein
VLYQKTAWKAEHKQKCGAPAPTGPTCKQARLVTRLVELVTARDWQSVKALESEALLVVQEIRDVYSDVACDILRLVGSVFRETEEYTRARELLEQAKALSEEKGDRARLAEACEELGSCCFRTGNIVRALELHEQQLAIAQELGNQSELALACGKVALCYYSTGDYVRALELNLQLREIAEALGDREVLAAACGNIGNCYSCMGLYSPSREMCEQARAICEELGDREGVGKACGNLGVCSLNSGDFAQAILYFMQQYNAAKEMQAIIQQAAAAFSTGVARRLEVRANVRGRAAGGSEMQHVLARWPASPCNDDEVREAEKWLQIALELGCEDARLHLAHLAFDAGQQDTALAHLQDYLSYCMEQGRNSCAGCFQKRSEDAQMLTCGGCRVARFCSAEHQKMASKGVASGRSLLCSRHKHMCGVLGKWRQQVVKDGMSPDVLREDLLAFLRA